MILGIRTPTEMLEGCRRMSEMFSRNLEVIAFVFFEINPGVVCIPMINFQEN